ncbi:MAG TPA: hypothetical protein VGO64_11590 [Candidatus Limnocylindrales bacterium]|nr:hypothetical protein [Candidatus Limnocylindrales bacterium]
MPDRKDQLPDESDRLLAKVADLRELERTKRTEPISSEAFHRLAKEITKKSREIMFAAREQELSGEQSERDDRSIDDLAEEPRTR